jgi:peptidoglycan hydrolase-like protein with peptidoglycan-binding domain
MGAGTAAALKAFQSSRGLPVGVLTKDTFRALGLIR